MGELWSAYGGQVWRAMLAASAGRRDLADDVTQEAFARLIVYRETVQDPLGWLFRTAYRLLAAELRDERRRGGEAVDQTAVVAEGFSAELVSALSGLDPKVRLCVFLRYYADLPVGEVARLTGMSVTATKVRLHRARRRLRATLDEKEVSRV